MAGGGDRDLQLLEAVLLQFAAGRRDLRHEFFLGNDFDGQSASD